MPSPMRFLSILVILTFCANQLLGQFDGPRTYWALPKNLNILAAHLVRANGNASINNFTFINPDAAVNSNLFMISYTRSQPLFERTFYSTLILPAGDLTATVNVDPQLPGTPPTNLYQHGLGDIVWTNSINVFGAKGLALKDFVRHENPTLIYLRASFSFPTGRYEPENPINLGSNQFKVKLGMPVVQRIGPLVDGKRMSLELTPSYLIIGTNKDFLGMEVEQSGIFTLECHLTRDITRKAFIAVDYSYISGGSSDFINRETGIIEDTQPGQSAHLVGVTLNFNINDYLNLFLTHNQSFGSGGNFVSLEGTITKLTLSWSFHDFQEKMRAFLESN